MDEILGLFLLFGAVETIGLWVIMSMICAMIANNKGHSGLAFFVYGLLIWPIALVHALLLDREEVAAKKALADEFVRAQIDLPSKPPQTDPNERRPCPFCAEAILPAAKLCPHCRSELPSGWVLRSKDNA